MSRKNAGSIDGPHLREAARWEYVGYALQYYAAARFAYFAGSSPVTGSLFHHAVEFLLKQRLIVRLTPEVLSRKPYGHDLERLWKEFKAGVADAALDRFDTAIAELHRFEDIRYPENLYRRGATFQFILKREHVGPPGMLGTRPLPSYNVALEEADDLMLVLFDKCSVNLPAFAWHFRGCAGEYL